MVDQERDGADFLRMFGSTAFRIVLKPEYKLDERLNVHRECNIPPSTLYMPLGWDEVPEDNRKHYRRFFPDELEYVTEIMPKQSPFDQFYLKRGQTRGAKKSLFSFGK